MAIEKFAMDGLMHLLIFTHELISNIKQKLSISSFRLCPYFGYGLRFFSAFVTRFFERFVDEF